MLSKRRFPGIMPDSRQLIFGVAAFVVSYYIISICLNLAPALIFAQTSETTSPTLSATGSPTIQITSVQDGQQVPSDELKIEGMSSDNEDSNCNVYADINDINSMQNVTGSRR